MRIRTIFECGGKHLYAVLFEETDGIKDSEFYANIEGERENLTKNEFDKAFDRWQDVEYLKVFFNKYRSDLTSFDSAISVSNAIKYTTEDAAELISKLDEIEINSAVQQFEQLFKPLVNDEQSDPPYELQRLKGKGSRHKSWLRLYALRYGDSFVVTGGAIKLTRIMNGRPHLKFELYKLDLVRKFLEDNGKTGSAGFIDITV
jgi:hypothetical protein